MAIARTLLTPVAPPWRDRSFKTHNTSAWRNMEQALVAETGPLAGLQGRNVLAIVDVENLTISARKLGYELDYSALGRRLVLWNLRFPTYFQNLKGASPTHMASCATRSTRRLTLWTA